MSAARIAVVGASGWAGSRHVEAFVAAGARIVALVDPSPLTAELARRHGAAALGSADELDPAEIDLVVVALPSRIQPGVVAPLLARGFRVLEEKPIAASLADAEALGTAPGVRERLMVGYTLHQHPAFAALREWTRGVVPVSISVRSVARKTRVDSWRADPLEGGVVVVNAIHAIELAASLLDATPSVAHVDSRSSLYGSGVPEYVAATATFPTGTVFRLETYWSPWDNSEGLNAGDWDLTVDVVAREGRRLWRNDRLSAWERDGAETVTEYPPSDLFAEQAVDALRFAAGGPPTVGYEAALRATRAAESIVAHPTARLPLEEVVR